MTLTRARFFIRKSAFGRRDFFILRLRHLFSHSPYVLFLSCDGLPSSPLNELRALAANYHVGVQLMLRRWATSIFSFNGSSRMPFGCRLLVLHSANAKNLMALTQDSLFPSLLEDLPFFVHSYEGLLSQSPFFSFLLENPKERLLILLVSLSYYLVPLLEFSWEPLWQLLRLLLLRSESN